MRRMSCLSELRIDGRFVGWAVAWGALAWLILGIVTAIIPNPVFGRSIPPEPFAIGVWLVSAPLMGIVGATYASPPIGPVRGTAAPRPLTPAPVVAAGDLETAERRSGRLGTVAGVGAFLAIGCPVCNKVALVLLGTSGALSLWAPLQPLVGALSVLLLAVTVAWRLRLRRTGACPA